MPRPGSSSTYRNISERGIHGNKGQEWLLGLKAATGEFLHKTWDVRAGESDRKDFPLCNKTVSKIEGYFSRHVSSSLGQNSHWSKAIRLQKSYPGLNLSSVCLRQARDSSFEESKLEIYSLLRYLLLHCCTFFSALKLFASKPLVLTTICQPSEKKEQNCWRLHRGVLCKAWKELSTFKLPYI